MSSSQTFNGVSGQMVQTLQELILIYQHTEIFSMIAPFLITFL